MGAAGAAGGATYIDDVFHTEVFKSTNQNADYKVTNNIDNAGEGGFLWYKQRNGSSWHLNWDTARGSNKYIYTNSNSPESTGVLLKSFDADGYTIQTGTTLVDPARENVLWNFRKAEGFFDVVTYTGNGTAGRTVAHNLGSVPGCIMIKRLNDAEDWAVYHRQVGAIKALTLNENSASNTNSAFFNDTEPTASVFSVGTSDRCNKNGQTYVAYVFAGGPSTAVTAKSVDFDGSGDYLSFADNDVWSFGGGTNSYSAECFFKIDALTGAGWDAIFGQWQGNNNSTLNSWTVEYVGTSLYFYYIGADGQMYNENLGVVSLKDWHHLVVMKNGGTLIAYVDGVQKKHVTIGNVNTGTGSFNIGGNVASAGWINGQVSNVRIVVSSTYNLPYPTAAGGSFRIPTEPLTTTSQGVTSSEVKLLCCNDSSITGSTVTPVTITSGGNPTSSTDTPFDDPEGFKFGADEDQNLIKCGSYQGTGSSTEYEVNLGFEPQWLMVKCATAVEDWCMFDSMRGIVMGGDDPLLRANLPNTETGSLSWLDLTPTGFKVNSSAGGINEGNHTMIYIAIRRPDGYVGKPALAGTEVFAMDGAGGNNAQPTFDLGIAVDAVMHKQPAANTTPFMMSDRLRGGRFFDVNTIGSEQNNLSNIKYDYMNGMGAWTGDLSSYQAWGWKRQGSFDVVCYDGDPNNVNKNLQVVHSLNAVPEMIWVKCRSHNGQWVVGHTGLNGGTNPWNYYMAIDSTAAQIDNTVWADTAPTASHFTVGANFSSLNTNGRDYVSYLFASVAGISKCGYYAGLNSGSTQTITTGFQPRFIIIKSYSNVGNWLVYDTTRGWASGNDEMLWLDAYQAQEATEDIGNPISTGFTINGGTNASYAGRSYIYYAHA